MMNSSFSTQVIYSDDINSKKILDLLLKGLSAFARLANYTFLVIDTDEHQLIYQSDKQLYLEDKPYQITQGDWGNPYWNCVTNDTLNVLLQIKDKSLLMAQTMDDDDFHTFICTLDYPILIKGKEFFVHQEFLPLVVHADRTPKYGLVIICPSTSKTIESHIHVKSQIQYRFDFKTGKYRDFHLDTSLSLKEKEILQLVQKGLTIKEIADKLHTSMSTVKTHRMRLFKKLQVVTMSEALTATRNYHLI